MRRVTDDDAKGLAASTSLTRRGPLRIRRIGHRGCCAPKGDACRSLSPDRSNSQQAVSSVMERLSAYMSEAGSRTLPAEVVEKTKQHILDTLAAMISGSELPPDVRRFSLLEPTAAGRSQRSSPRISLVVQSKPRLPTACSLTPTRPTIRTLRRNRTQVAQSFPLP